MKHFLAFLSHTLQKHPFRIPLPPKPQATPLLKADTATQAPKRFAMRLIRPILLRRQRVRQHIALGGAGRTIKEATASPRESFSKTRKIHQKTRQNAPNCKLFSTNHPTHPLTPPKSNPTAPECAFVFCGGFRHIFCMFLAPPWVFSQSHSERGVFLK